MSDYLERLTNRLFGLQRDLLPRRRLLYEPESGVLPFDQTIDESDEQTSVMGLHADSSDPNSPTIRLMANPVIESQAEAAPPTISPVRNEQHVFNNSTIVVNNPQALPPVSPTDWKSVSLLPEKVMDAKDLQFSPRSLLQNKQPSPHLTAAQPAMPVKQSIIQQEAVSLHRKVGSSSLNPAAYPGGAPENNGEVVQVTIGRIEVRLSQPAPQSTRAVSKPQAPRVGLGEYLQRRDRGKS